MAKSTTTSNTVKAVKPSTTSKSSSHTNTKKMTKPDRARPKDLSNEISAEASQDATMLDVTGDDENNPKQSSSPTSKPKDPPQHQNSQINQHQDDTSQTSHKFDDTNKMTNKNTSTTTPNNRFQILDPNVRVFTPATNTNETGKNTRHADNNNKDQSSKQVIKRTHDGLYSLKLPTNDNKNAAAEMQRALTEWFREMKEVDSSIVIYDWKNDTKTRAITKTTEITAKVAPMKHFFYQILPRSTKGFMWCSVHIGHDGLASELDEGMEWWYEEKKGGFYKRALQYKDSIQIAWLLYSHEKVDRDLLTEKLIQEYKKM